ncbi:MAG: hypothetical protein ABR537_07220, partial [Gemmatimonadales bacterium]
LGRAIPILTIAVGALYGAGCAFPTDKSDKVFLTLDAPSHVVLRGQDVSVYARAWRVMGADTQPITNVDFAFGSGSGSIARVQNDGGGYATVTGVNSGSVDILARAISFEGAVQADLVLRVANPLEIDSVRPRDAHYGQVLTVYGVGVDSMFLASLGDVNLIEYPFSRLRDPATGLGQIAFWVPPPAHSDQLFFLGAGVFGLDTGTTNVLKDDVYEPNDTVPSDINLDLGGPWPGTALAPILFLNPALAFEPLERGTDAGIDWFHFATADTTQSLTFFITYPTFGDTSAAATRTFLLDSLAYATGAAGDPVEKFFGRDSADFISSDFYRCKGDEFNPAQLPRESTTVALKTLPSHDMHIVTFFSRTQRYALTVAQGYFTADARIKADAYEENDLCHYTDSIPGRPSPKSRIKVSTVQFSDTMNIDNPFEIDWYRIEVPAHGVDDSVLFRLQGRPFIGGRDSSDIDIYVETVPGSTGPDLSEVGSSVNAGSTEDLMLDLPAGSYYLAAADYAGVAMRYSMCIRVIPALALQRSCSLILPGPAMPQHSKARPQASARTSGSTRSSFLGTRSRRP